MGEHVVIGSHGETLRQESFSGNGSRVGVLKQRDILLASHHRQCDKDLKEERDCIIQGDFWLVQDSRQRPMFHIT